MYRRKERICYIEQEKGQETYINERKGHMGVKNCIGRKSEYDTKQEKLNRIYNLREKDTRRETNIVLEERTDTIQPRRKDRISNKKMKMIHQGSMVSNDRKDKIQLKIVQ